jgi:BCD family chlorophyll transporter-like MFS transporter
MADAILKNPVARTFFWYLFLLLAAILGQDVLLEPYGAEAFGLTVQQTTRITSLWGTAVLASILVAGALEGRVARRTVAQIGNIGALLGFLVILASGFMISKGIFYTGVLLLGAGTGLSTVANLAVMFELTVPGMVGLFIGAWGVSNALSRLAGSLLAGVVRDVVAQLSGNAIAGYMAVFAIESLMLAAAIFLLGSISVDAFRQKAKTPEIHERLGMMSD